MRSRHPRRAAALGLLLTLAGAPASALTRSGSMAWRFGDITTRDPSGRSHYSSWGQDYGLNLGGDLLHPSIGTFKTGGRYSEGTTINTAVNLAGGQRVAAYDGALDLFTPDVQRYVRFAPNYAVQRTRYTGRPEHTVTSDNWGYGTGVSVPYLPAVSVGRQYQRLRDSFGVVPTDQRQTAWTENVAYAARGLRLNANQERHRTEDSLAARPSPLSTSQRGSLDYSPGAIKRLGLQYLNLHGEYLRFATDDATTVKSVATLVNLRTRDLKAGDWKHSLNYANDARRDILHKTQDMIHTAQLSSGRPIRRGNVVNTAAGSVSSGARGTSRSASLSPHLNLAFRDGRVLTSFDGGVGWSRSPSGPAMLSDSAGTRLDVRPHRALELFTDLQTSESRTIAAETTSGQRQTRFSLGETRRYGGGSATARYDRTMHRTYATGESTSSDQVNLNLSATPAERLNANAGASYSQSRSSSGDRYDSKNFTGSLSYASLWGLNLSADASFADRSQYTTSASASYAIGKTSLSLSFAHSATPLPSSYTAFGVTLSRSL